MEMAVVTPVGFTNFGGWFLGAEMANKAVFVVRVRRLLYSSISVILHNYMPVFSKILGMFLGKNSGICEDEARKFGNVRTVSSWKIRQIKRSLINQTGS